MLPAIKSLYPWSTSTFPKAQKPPAEAGSKTEQKTYTSREQIDLLNQASDEAAENLYKELRKIRKELLEIPDSLKLPSLSLLFNYISGSNEEPLKINSKLSDHVYFVKRNEHDGIIFLISDKNQSLKADEIQAEIAPEVNKIFKEYPELGKIITIPLKMKVDSLTDVLETLNKKPKTEAKKDEKPKIEAKRDERVESLKSKLEIGSSQTFYPEHKKNYPNHVELVLSKFFEKFKKIERVSRPDFDLFVYNLNKQQNLIVDFQDRSQSLTSTNNQSDSKEQHIAALKRRYRDAPVLEITTDGKKEGLGEKFQIEYYKKLGPTRSLIAASTDSNLYDLRLEGAPKSLTKITENSGLQNLTTKFKNRLPENPGARGEKIIEALFNHWGAETKVMSSNPKHSYDLEVKINKATANSSPLKLLQKNSSSNEIPIEIKTSRDDDSSSIRNLTINQVYSLREGKGLVAKVVVNGVNDNAKDSFMTAEEIFEAYPYKVVENEDGFAVLTPDLEKSRDQHSPYSKIYLFTFNELQGRDESGELKAPATISKLKLSIDLEAVKAKIAQSEGIKQIDLSRLGKVTENTHIDEMTILEETYFDNLKKLRAIEQSLGKANDREYFKTHGLAETFAHRGDLRERLEKVMKELMITQFKNNHPNLKLIQYYSAPFLDQRPPVRTDNPETNENIFILQDKQTGKIEPCEIMCFSPKHSFRECTLDSLISRDIYGNNKDAAYKLPVQVAFYNGNNTIYLLEQELLPQKALESLAKWEDLNDVRRGTYMGAKGSIWKDIKPIATHLRSERMFKHLSNNQTLIPQPNL